MTWINIVWPMMAAACLTLALVHLLVWFRQPAQYAYLLFSMAAIAATAMAAGEMMMMNAASVDAFATTQRWAHVATFVVIVCLVAFLRVFFVSNAAGLLTLVGDPATFIVGSAIGMTFTQYLRQVSFGGVLAVLVIVPLLPRLMPEVWNTRSAPATAGAAPRVERPWFAAFALCVLGFMVLMFLFGEALPVRIVPPSVAILAAALALLVVYGARVESVDEALRAVGWKTLLFLGAIMCLMQGFIKTSLLQGLSLRLYGWFGTDFTPVALAMLARVGVLSSVLANIPVAPSDSTLLSPGGPILWAAANRSRCTRA
jgi:Na+/H+ antiporter NhaD/arsenite permease-like protein